MDCTGNLSAEQFVKLHSVVCNIWYGFDIMLHNGKHNYLFDSILWFAIHKLFLKFHRKQNEH